MNMLHFRDEINGIDLNITTAADVVVRLKEDLTSDLEGSPLSGFILRKSEKAASLLLTDEFVRDMKLSCTVLNQISQKYSFNTFVYMAEFLRTIPHGKLGNIEYLVEALKHFEYESLLCIETYLGGNCVDFAIKAKNDLSVKGVNVEIIGTIPDEEDYNETQSNFMGVRHTSLLYERDGNYVLFEPGRKCPYPIIVNEGYLTGNSEWLFSTKELSDGGFLQETIMPANNWKKNMRQFRSQKVSIDESMSLTKKLTRIPRRFDILNPSSSSDGYIIAFKPQNNGKLFTNVPNVSKTFCPGDLTFHENDILSATFGIENIKDYFVVMFEKYFNIADEFRIR